MSSFHVHLLGCLIIAGTLGDCESVKKELEDAPPQANGAELRIDMPISHVVAGGELQLSWRIDNVPSGGTGIELGISFGRPGGVTEHFEFVNRLTESSYEASMVLRVSADAEPGAHRVVFRARDDNVYHVALERTVVIVPPIGPPAPRGIRSIAAGTAHSLAFMEDGTVWTWGRNDQGQLGLGEDFSPRRSLNVPAAQRAGTSPEAIFVAGGSHTLRVRRLVRSAWGSNRFHQLHDGSEEHEIEPVGITTRFRSAPVAAAGLLHTLTTDRHGRVWGWGSNAFSQTLNNLAPPAMVPSLQDIEKLGAGAYHSLAIDSEGKLFGWGRNDDGQLGFGPNVIEAPVHLHRVQNVVQAAGGDDFTVVLLADGTVWAFGDNTSGQLGNEAAGTTERDPVQVSGLANVVAIVAGGKHCLAVDANGDLYAWGSNVFGQLGVETLDTFQATPIRVAAMSNVVHIAAGANHSLAARSDCPHLYAWGRNDHGQLGDGTTHNRVRPVQVDGIGDGDAVNRSGCRVGLTLVAPQFGAITIDGTGIQCGGDGARGSCAEGFAYGTEVRLTAVADEGYEFERWVGGSTATTPTTTVTMDQAKNVSAVFRKAVPPASFVFSPNPAVVGADTFFDASASGDDIVSYEWDFGDGTNPVTTANPTISHVYDAPGSYLVTLRATDGDGQVRVATDSVPALEGTTFPLTIRINGTGGTVSIPELLLETDETTTFNVEGGRRYTIRITPPPGAGVVATGCDPSATGECTVLLNGAREITVTFLFEPGQG